MDPFVVTSLGKKTYRTRVVNHNLNPVFDEKLVFNVQKHEVNYSLNFTVVDRDKFSGNDFVGTALFPLDKVKTLSPEADSGSGLYKLPDPDTVTEGETRRKRFRLPMSRSNSQSTLSRNSSSSNLEKLTRTASSNSLNHMNAPPKPKLKRQGSENDAYRTDRNGPTSAPSSTSLAITDEPQDMTNSDDLEPAAALYSFELPLELKNKQRWENKHSPVLYIRAKYLPYRALRQQFWRAMLKHYDADESGKIDKVELVTMLDTLGSTLHNSTINGFFKRWAAENGGEEVLTMDQAVICLEEQLMKSKETHSHMHIPHWKSRHPDQSTRSSTLSTLANGGSPDESPGNGTPYLGGKDSSAPNNLDPNSSSIPALEVSDLSEAGEQGDHLPVSELSLTDSLGDDMEPDLNEDVEAKEEHVVEIHECPICHMPRLQRGRNTTDADIITHIATCASSDWRAVNNLVMAGFVTSSQAQRKWYSKVITKISYGGYKLGANSANILVQDRLTGMINEERMSVYVRLGIRLLYKGLKSRDMEKRRSMCFLVPRAVVWTQRHSVSVMHAVCQGYESCHAVFIS